MSEMVQKVANAIRTYAVRVWGAPHLYAVVKSDAWDTPILSGMSDGIAYVEAAKLNARAAIEAMREPPLNMSLHGMAEVMDSVKQSIDPDLIDRTWNRMIDAALKE